MPEINSDSLSRNYPSGEKAGCQVCVALGAALLLMSHQVGESLVLVVIGPVIDRAVATADYAALARWLIVLAIVFVDLSLSYRFGARLSQHAVQYAAHERCRVLCVRDVEADHRP